MRDSSGEVQQLPGVQDMGLILCRNLDGALDALNRDFSRDLVRWQRLACREDQAHDLQILGLEQRDRLLVCQASTKRPNLDGLSGVGVRNRHGREYALGAGCDA